MCDKNSLAFADLIVSNHPAIIILACAYLVALLYTLYRAYVAFSHARTRVNNTWDIPKVYVCLVSVSIFIRVVTFGALTFLIAYTDNFDIDPFLQNMVTVLFNFGDWATLSIYLMLLVIWIETLQLTRRHFFNSARIRRSWLTVFVLANVFLYLSQLTLYGIAFLAPKKFTDPAYLSKILFTVTASINVFLPCVLLVAWMIYFCLLAGFPYKSLVGKAMFKHMMHRVIYWTVSREAWGVFIILFSDGKIGRSSTWLFATILVSMFLATELLPALCTIDHSTMQYMQPLNEVSLVADTVQATGIGILPYDYLKTAPLSTDDDYSYPPSFINDEMSEPLLTAAQHTLPTSPAALMDK